MNEFNDLHYAASAGDLEAVKELLREGFDLNGFDEIGLTPLHHTAQEEQHEVMRALLKAGADVNAHDEENIGDTPLGMIAGDCSLETTEILVEYGADPTISGWMQLSALDRAKARKRPEGRSVYELLCKAAAQSKRP